MADSEQADPMRKEAGGGESVDEEGGVPLTSQCSVCTAPAAEHRHYGAVSCYSCRAFFRRGVPKQLRCIFGHNQCKLDQHNRTNCKLCRYHRCLETGMRPDKVNKYLNRRKEREAMIARCGGLPGEQKETPKLETSPEQAQPKYQRHTEPKQQQSNKLENYAYSKAASLRCDPAGYPHLIDVTGYPSRPPFDWSYGYGPVHPPQEQVTLQREMNGQVKQSVVTANNDNMHIPDINYKKPMSSPLDDKFLLELSPKSPKKEEFIYPTTITETYRGTSPDSSTGSSVIQFASSKLGRPEVVVLKEENCEENKEATEKTIRDNPVLPFTLEEEFKVIDFIVRIEDYFTKRFVFIDKNFGGGGFPEYNKLTMENAACTKISGKLPYDPMMEGRLFNLALNFTQLNIDHFYDEMKRLSPEVKIKMLTTSFPATYVIFYAILENNNAMQPLSLGREKVGNIRMRDMERFTSPWALDYADEVKFNNTVQRVGEVLGSDMKLQALYHMLVMMTPWHKQAGGSYMLGLQASVSQLIYRYLASEEGVVAADRKTRLLLSLVQHIHTAAHIMQHRTRRPQQRNQLLPATPTTYTETSRA